jgi:hypothetical protein
VKASLNQIGVNMDLDMLYDVMISNCLVDINEGTPERTGKHAQTVARYSVAYWATSMSRIGDIVLELIAAVHDINLWVKNSLQGQAWATVVSFPMSPAQNQIAIIIHCDEDIDAVLVALTYDKLPPIIKL